jgi:hypothetical protein
MTTMNQTHTSITPAISHKVPMEYLILPAAHHLSLWRWRLQR